MHVYSIKLRKVLVFITREYKIFKLCLQLTQRKTNCLKLNHVLNYHFKNTLLAEKFKVNLSRNFLDIYSNIDAHLFFLIYSSLRVKNLERLGLIKKKIIACIRTLGLNRINCIHVIQVTFQILYKSDIVILEQKSTLESIFYFNIFSNRTVKIVQVSRSAFLILIYSHTGSIYLSFFFPFSIYIYKIASPSSNTYSIYKKQHFYPVVETKKLCNIEEGLLSELISLKQI